MTIRFAVPRRSRPLRGLFSAFLFVFALQPVAHAVITETVTSIGFENPTILLDSDEFDGDPSTIRNGLHANIEVTVARSNPFDPGVNTRYRVVYSLQNSAGNQLDLANGDPGDITEVTSPVFLVSLPGFPAGANSHVEQIAAAPDPVATLDPAFTYRVVSRLEREAGPGLWVIVDDTPTTDTNFTNILHFTNTASGDAEYNFRGLLFTLSWDQQFLVDTDPSNDALLASATAVFGRYDEFDLPIAQQTTDIIFDFDLLDGANNSVPLVDDGIVTVPLTLDSYDNTGARNLPDFDTVFVSNTPLRPAVQLDSVNETYRLVCTLRHEEDAVPNEFSNMELEIAPEPLLHFNGNLDWGGFATQFTGLENTPTPMAGGPTWVDTTIVISNEAGVLPGNPNYVFGNGVTPLDVELLANGDARLPAAPPQSLVVFPPGNPGGDVTANLNGIQVTYAGGVTLGNSGANAAGITIHLPQGMGYIADRVANPFCGEPEFTRAGPYPLAPDLDPTGDLSFGLPGNAAIFDESHPLLFRTSSFTLELAGRLNFDTIAAQYIHEECFTYLENLPPTELEDPAFMRERFSNDLYLRAAHTSAGSSHLWTPATDHSARMTGELNVDPIVFRTHFPQGATIDCQAGGSLLYEAGVAVSAASELGDVPQVEVPYNIDCPEDPCAGGGEVIVAQIPDDLRLTQTPTGGLWRSGNVAPTVLRWGARGDGVGGIHPDYPYAHRTDEFTRSSFFMSGYQLYADSNATLTHQVYASAGGDNAAGVLLNGGFNDEPGAPSVHSVTEQPYIDGDGSYPGLNFIVEGTGQTGASRLGGNTSDFTYELFFNNNNACKYYIRRSGVSGRQVALDGSWSNPLFIYGFEFNFDSFQLSFLDSVPEESWVDGSIEVTGYSNFTQQFTGLMMDCLGELTGADIDPNDLGDKALTYWRSVFNPTYMAFTTKQVPEPPPDVCPLIFEGALLMGIKTEVAHIPTTLNGVFGFKSNGNLLVPDDGFKGIDAAETPVTSELSIPPHITLEGPNQDWTLVSVGDLRFNNPEEAGHPDTSVDGFVTWGATINVPYFNDLQVQCITSAPAGNSAPFYMAPGWDEGGKTFFGNIDFDPKHKSWPIGSIGLSDYQSNVNAAWLVEASQDLFGSIPLNYPLKWDDNRRMFQSFDRQTEDFFVVNTFHEVPYMDAKFLKIEFGAQYEGLPEISIADMLNSEISKASQALDAALTGTGKSGIDEAFEKFDDMLSDSMVEVFEPIVDAAADAVLAGNGGVYQQLKESYESSFGTSRMNWENIAATAILDTEIFKAPGFTTTLRDQLELISDATNETASFAVDLKEAVEKMIIGIDIIANQVQTAGGVPQFNATLPPPGPIQNGILHEESGEYQIVQSLVDLLLRNLLEPEVAAIVKPLLNDATSELNAELLALIEESKPALGQLVAALNQAREVLVILQDDLETTVGFFQDIDAVVQNAISNGDMDLILSPINDIVRDLIGDLFDSNSVQAGTILSSSQLSPFADMSEEEFVALVKSELLDQLLQNGIVEQIQFLLRQQLYDLQAKFSSTIQSAFTQMSEIIKDVVSEAVGSLDTSMTSMLGDVSKYAGSAEITGYAEFNGDSLRKLRMDLEAQFQMPDEMQIHVYLEVCVITSEDNPNGNGCIQPGEKAVEVRIGAVDVPFDWISDGLRCTLEVKISLKDYDGDGGPLPLVPIGFGGSLELTGGEIDFNSFKITEFGVALAIGLEEAYIAAKARVEFSSYEMAAGIFFGRTCTPEPIRFCDPDVADLLDPGTTFTGACVYGEVWLPISQIILGIPPSCLFRVSAGVGAGAFFFLEGPTFGGSMLLGVSGEAICIVSFEGSIKMTGVVQDGKLKARGNGKFEACIGIAFIEICFNATVKMTYDDGDWDLDY